jgi:hypothetical protein
MEFFKKLFSGGGAREGGQFYYVKPTGCTEIVRVRVDTMKESRQNDDNDGFFVRKSARGTSYKCTRTAEILFTYDSQKRLINTEIMGGTIVTEADYDAWLKAEGASSTS